MNTKSDNPTLIIVIPLYNEGEILPSFAPSLIEFFRRKDWRLIVVNDGSCDQTKCILDEFRSSAHVRVVHHKVNRGYGGALKTGISHVTTPYLVTMDGHGQHNYENVEKVFQFARANDADMVVGKREGKHVSTIYRSPLPISTPVLSSTAPIWHQGISRFVLIR